MFFSEELLTRRKDGLGIFCCNTFLQLLLGTLGARTRRVSKKEIVSCDLVRACETIAEPPEPMALRMSSCLLIGVARVYNQSCDHLYKDVSTFHTSLRQALITTPVTGSSAHIAGLDMPSERIGRVEQITIGAAATTDFQETLDWGFGRLSWDELGVALKRKADDAEDDEDFDDEDQIEDDGYEAQAKAKQVKKSRLAHSSHATSERPSNMANEADITLPRHRLYSGSFDLNDGSEDERHSRELNDQYFAGGDVADALGLDLGEDFGYAGASSSAHGGFEQPFEDVNMDMAFDMNTGLDFVGNYGDEERRASQSTYDGEAVAEQARRDLEGGFDTQGLPRMSTPALSDGRRKMATEDGSDTSATSLLGDTPAVVANEQRKPKKPPAKKVKTLPSDQALELHPDTLRAFKADYSKSMDDQRAAASKKDNDRLALETGRKLLQGPWEWLPFIAPDMIDYYLDLSTPKPGHGQPTNSPDRIEGSLFDEEDLDLARQRVESREPRQGYDDMDMYNDMDVPIGDVYGDTRYADNFEEYRVPLKGGSEDPPLPDQGIESEVGRRASQAFSAAGGNFPWDMPGDDSFDNFAIPSSSAPGARYSVAGSVDANVRLNRRLSSLGASSDRRSTSVDPFVRRRSVSIVPSRFGSELQFEEFGDLELPATTPEKGRHSSVVNEGLSQDVLESLDLSCRNFLMHVNKKQYKASGDPVVFSEVFPSNGKSRVTRHVACQAFYNCLSLSTKKLLVVQQSKPWTEITISIPQTI